MGVKCNMTSSYYPQSNGLDERFNQTLQRQVLKYLGEGRMIGIFIWMLSSFHIECRGKIPPKHSHSCLSTVDNQNFLYNLALIPLLVKWTRKEV